LLAKAVGHPPQWRLIHRVRYRRNLRRLLQVLRWIEGGSDLECVTAGKPDCRRAGSSRRSALACDEVGGIDKEPSDVSGAYFK
jgi:hypothetical protein